MKPVMDTNVIVTHNVRDLAGAQQFSVEVMAPAEFLIAVRQTI